MVLYIYVNIIVSLHYVDCYTSRYFKKNSSRSEKKKQRESNSTMNVYFFCQIHSCTLNPITWMLILLDRQQGTKLEVQGFISSSVL